MKRLRRGWREGSRNAARSGVVPIVVIVVVIVVEVFVLVVPIVVVVLVPIVLVFVFLVFVLILIVAGPAFRLLGLLQVELVPGIEVDLLDIAVFVLHLDQFLVGVHGQHFEDLVFF